MPIVQTVSLERSKFVELTVEIVSRFVGGQLEVQNSHEEYLYRGEIATATVENGDLKITLAWFAKGEGFPPFPIRWIKDDKLDYACSLMIYGVRKISNERILLQSWITHETVVLFPPDSENKLDQSKVVDPVPAVQ